MSDHTPGPWCLGSSDQAVCDLAICTAYASPMQGATIARLVARNGTEYNNANLIAAAPKLLADLCDAAKTLRTYEALHRVKGTAESITKAEVNAALAARFEATIAKATMVTK